MCDQFGADEVRQRVQVLAALDTMVQVCFSPIISDPRDGLLSNYDELKDEVNPIILWNPRPVGKAWLLALIITCLC